MKYVISALLFALPMAAQEIKMPPGLDELAERASETVDVNLDGSLLQLAAKFLSDKDADEAHVKRMVAGLKGIYVKSFEFEKEGQYSKAEIDKFRAQFKAPTWARIVTTHSKKAGDNADIFIKTEGDQIGGLVVIVTDPKELTIVNIIGSIRPEDVRDLGGHMGIPKIDVAPDPKNDKKTGKKPEEDEK